MEESLHFLEEDLITEIDWNSLFDDFPVDAGNFSEFEPPPQMETSSSLSPENQDPSNALPNSFASAIGEVETLLMKDGEDDSTVFDEDYYNNFVSQIIVSSPGEGSTEGGDAGTCTGKDSDNSDDYNGNSDEAKEDNDVVEADDPVSKKRRRQLRNRDAAMRSRERKKMYVKDMEMKSKYLEAECRRLGRLLQCCYAENQALRLSLQMGNAFGASRTKQESAVLFLELLLLGSLLWFMGIMCLFNLPKLELDQVENEGKKVPERVAQRGAGSRISGYRVPSSVKSRRYKWSWTKMKQSLPVVYIFV